MSEYRKGAHSVYKLHYHFVFTTKYRKPVLRGEIASKCRELIQQICNAHDVEIVKGHVRPDHIHIMLSLPPHVAPSVIMQAVKGKTSHHLIMSYRALNREFWGRHLWARGYFACTTGNVTDEAIKHYIEHQDAEPQAARAEAPTFRWGWPAHSFFRRAQNCWSVTPRDTTDSNCVSCRYTCTSASCEEQSTKK